MWAKAALRPCGALEPESSSLKLIPSMHCRQPWKVRTEGNVEINACDGVSVCQRRSSGSWPRKF